MENQLVFCIPSWKHINVDFDLLFLFIYSSASSMKVISVSYLRKHMKVETKFIKSINIYCASTVSVLGMKRKDLIKQVRRSKETGRWWAALDLCLLIVIDVVRIRD